MSLHFFKLQFTEETNNFSSHRKKEEATFYSKSRYNNLPNCINCLPVHVQSSVPDCTLQLRFGDFRIPNPYSAKLNISSL
nr:hypothetical protein Iba_chr01bCG9190 [Ipomoea batatas]